MKKIAQGAEAKLYLTGNKIIKDRFKKDYRIKEIDKKLRKSRTKREAKILDKLALIDFPAPKLIESDDKQKIVMDFVKGPTVRDILEKSNYKRLSSEIGKKVAILHNNNIIHGDLTTSNMILKSQKSKNLKEFLGHENPKDFHKSEISEDLEISKKFQSNGIYFIDFGLSFFSHKIEDKAVDLHLLKQALESKHYRIWEKCFKAALDSYKKECRDSSEVIKRLEKVESRGRYKSKRKNI